MTRTIRKWRGVLLLSVLLTPCVSLAETLELGRNLGPTRGSVFLVTTTLDRKWRLGVVAHGSQSLTRHSQRHKFTKRITVSPNIGLLGERTFGSKKLSASIGLTMWSKHFAQSGCSGSFALSAGYRITDRWGLRMRHWSNGGLCKKNYPLNVLTITYTF